MFIMITGRKKSRVTWSLLSTDELIYHLRRLKNILDSRQEAPDDETDSQQPDESQDADDDVENGHLSLSRRK